MKIFVLASLMVFFLVSAPVAEDIPRQLQAMGFNRYCLIQVTYDNVYHYYTFADWTSDQPGCFVIFVVQDGEVIDFYKDCRTQKSRT